MKKNFKKLFLMELIKRQNVILLMKIVIITIIKKKIK